MKYDIQTEKCTKHKCATEAQRDFITSSQMLGDSRARIVIRTDYLIDLFLKFTVFNGEEQNVGSQQ